MTTVERRTALREDRVAQYERMVEIRVVEDRVKDLFQEGVVRGTTHTAQGQEAVAVGVALATQPTDVVACTYRGHAAALALGVSVDAVLGEIMGRTAGPMRGLGGSMHLSDPAVGLLPTMAIIGAGIPVAAGAALTAQVLGTGAVAVSVFGDGATNIGAFHEGLNLAAIWRLPVVFVCENNLYGEYSRIDLTTPVTDIATRGAAYAMPSHIVDGQDLDTVTAAVSAAVEQARAGSGPSLLEMKTYRYSGHSRSDQALYRLEGELDTWLGRDPLTIFRGRLAEEGLLTAERVRELHREVEQRVDAAVERVKAAPTPALADMFAHVYSPRA
jgi:pyruvate dehydrogenase E1 component alpha subunit